MREVGETKVDSVCYKSLATSKGGTEVLNRAPLPLPLNILPLGVRVWKHIRVAKGMGGFVKGTRVWHKINIFRAKFV